MSEQEVQPIMITIEGSEYDINAQSDAAKEHFIEVSNLRQEITELQNNIAAATRRAQSLQIALGFRENALKESITLVEGSKDVPAQG